LVRAGVSPLGIGGLAEMLALQVTGRRWLKFATGYPGVSD
jgi:hypothetical protein